MIKSIKHQKSRVLVAEPHPLVLYSLSYIINREQDMMCCGEARTIANTHKALKTSKPHLVTIGFELSNGDGSELIKHLSATHPSIPILVISHEDEILCGEVVLKAGARGM